jgi:hypothetical protein
VKYKSKSKKVKNHWSLLYICTVYIKPLITPFPKCIQFVVHVWNFASTQTGRISVVKGVCSSHSGRYSQMCGADRSFAKEHVLTFHTFFTISTVSMEVTQKVARCLISCWHTHGASSALNLRDIWKKLAAAKIHFVTPQTALRKWNITYNFKECCTVASWRKF